MAEISNPLSMVCRTCLDMLHFRKGRHSKIRTLFELEFDHHKSQAHLCMSARDSACFICQAICDRMGIDFTLPDSSSEVARSNATGFLWASLKRVRYSRPALRLDFRTQEADQARGRLVASFILIKNGELASFV